MEVGELETKEARALLPSWGRKATPRASLARAEEDLLVLQTEMDSPGAESALDYVSLRQP